MLLLNFMAESHLTFVRFRENFTSPELFKEALYGKDKNQSGEKKIHLAWLCIKRTN